MDPDPMVGFSPCNGELPAIRAVPNETTTSTFGRIVEAPENNA
jgi:hypothetical protein